MPRITQQSARAVWTAAGPILLICVVTMLLSQGSLSLRNVGNVMLVNMLVVVGLYMFSGQTGILSFGHVSFMALGAYISALLTMPTAQKAFQLPHLGGFLTHAELGTIPAAILAGVLVAAIGYAVAVALMRLSGLAAGIATLALLIIVNDVLSHWTNLTNGDTPLVGAPIDTTLLGTAVWLAIIIVGVVAFQSSRIGIRLRAARDDEYAAQAVGMNIAADRRLAFALSAGVVAVAGALYGHLLGAFSPGDFYLDETFITVAMLVVGGIGSLFGGVIGTMAVAALTYAFDQLEAGTTIVGAHISLPTGSAEIVLAGGLLAMLLFRPAGLSGGKEMGLPGQPWRKGRRNSAPVGLMNSGAALAEAPDVREAGAGEPTGDAAG